MRRVLHLVIGHLWSDWFDLTISGWATTGKPKVAICGCGAMRYDELGAILSELAREYAPPAADPPPVKVPG